MEKCYEPWSKAAKAGEPTTPLDTHLDIEIRIETEPDVRYHKWKTIGVKGR